MALLASGLSSVQVSEVTGIQARTPRMGTVARSRHQIRAHVDRKDENPLGIRLTEALKIYEKANEVLDRSRYYQTPVQVTPTEGSWACTRKVA